MFVITNLPKARHFLHAVILSCIITKISAEVSTANNQLATKLYSILAEKNEGDFIFSPFTLSTVLAMVNSGAVGRTAVEFEKALEFIESKEEVAQDYRRILTDFRRLYSMHHLALRPFIMNATVINEGYTDLLRDNFYEEIGFADFSETDKAKEEINNWVENVAESKIKNIILKGNLKLDSSVVLVNAMNFRGSWTSQFKVRDTQPSPFYYSQNKSRQIDMMFQRMDVPFAVIEELDATAIALPYRLTPANKKESRFELIVLLPNSRTGLKEMEKNLATYPFSLIIAKFLEKRDMYVYLPKLNITSTQLPFTDALKTLGLKAVFENDTADLSGIAQNTETPLYVSEIFQKINFTVDEAGSDGILNSGAVPFRNFLPPESFRVDRPFIGFLYDQERHIVIYAFRKTELPPPPPF